MNARRAILLGAAIALLATPLQAATPVPEGNRNVEQPPVPGASASRTQALRTTYDEKYRRIYQLLAEDSVLRAKIVQVAELYGIDPIHIVGAIVGEHTYNVDAYDRLQTYYVKAVSYMNSSFAFSYGGESIDAFIERPEFAACRALTQSYDAWTCRDRVWDKVFRGRTAEARRLLKKRDLLRLNRDADRFNVVIKLRVIGRERQ